MTLLCFLLSALFLVICQTTLLMINPVWDFAPDLYFILVAYLAFRIDIFRSVFILYFTGLMLDVLSGAVLGAYSLLCFSAYIVLRLLANKIKLGNQLLWQIPLIAGVFVFLSGFSYFILNVFYAGELAPWSWKIMLVRGAMIAVLVYPMFYLFDLIKKYFEHKHLPWNRLRLRPDNRYRSTSGRKER